MKPEKWKAVWRIGITRELFEEIRVNELWNEDGKPVHSQDCGEGCMLSELYGETDTGDRWAYDEVMSLQGGNGTPESWFENHFSLERVRRRGLQFLFPPAGSAVSQREFWRQDPRISWLYFKKRFEAVFPVLCDIGRTRLELDFAGTLEDGRRLKLTYVTGAPGRLFLEDRELVNICFSAVSSAPPKNGPERSGGPDSPSSGKHAGHDHPAMPEIGKPELVNGERVVAIYGACSFSALLKGLEMVAEKALFYAEPPLHTGKKRIYRLRRFPGGNILAEHTDLSEAGLHAAGAEKMSRPEVDGKRIGLFYWNYDSSAKGLGGYLPQAFYPDSYRLRRFSADSEKNPENGGGGRQDECYIALDELEDLEGWYPLDRFIWEDDPEPRDAGALRRILPGPICCKRIEGSVFPAASPSVE